MKYAIVTFGCRVNQADSLQIEESLIRRGGSAARPEFADLVVVNTCSVTASADQGARQVIRRLARENPAARVIVTGCYATRAAAELSQLPGVVAVAGNDAKADLTTLWSASGVDVEDRARDGLGDGPCGAALVPGDGGRTCWTLRAQTGCEERCSYCIIPSTRGPSRSRTPRELVAELRDVASRGFRELTVTGVHLGAWGRDLAPRQSLVGLLRHLARAAAEIDDGRMRIRISSLEPMDCTPELLSTVAGNPVFAQHLHLPLQHASDRVLAAMRRPYTALQYRRLVDAVRDRMPAAAIGADVLVGFPGETDADADALVRYLEGSPLTHLHVFPYADRPGTEASRFQPKVHGSATRARAAAVRSIGRVLLERFHQRQLDTRAEALTIDDGTLALTGNYLKVRIPPGQPRNRWVTVRITGVSPALAGEVIDTPQDVSDRPVLPRLAVGAR